MQVGCYHHWTPYLDVRRIMDNDIKAQPSLLERISEKGIINNSKNSKTTNKTNKEINDIFNIKGIHKTKQETGKIKLSNEDKKCLEDALKTQFKSIAEKYYLDYDIKPKTTVKNNKIAISFELHEK